LPQGTFDCGDSNTSLQIRLASDGTNGFKFRTYDSGSYAYRILFATDGDITTTTGSYGTISDEKLKQDISDASSQWDDIKALRIRKFRFKDIVENDADAPYFIGVVAQEVEAAGMTNLINETDDWSDDGSEANSGNVPLGTTTKKLKQSILYMKAVKALQEAMTRIETLEAKVAVLEG